MATTSHETDYRRIIQTVLLWGAVLLVTAIALYPFLWAIITSFKPQRDALQPTLIPWVQFQPIMDNWNAELGRSGEENINALKNSAIIALGATGVALTLGTMVGYALGRFRFGIGNRNLVSWFLSQRFLPPVATRSASGTVLRCIDKCRGGNLRLCRGQRVLVVFRKRGRFDGF